MRGLSAYGVQRSANSLGVLRQRDITTLPLLDGLVAYWKLDEGSGTRIDSAGPNNLADNGSVGSTTGKVGNAALFNGINFLTVTNPSLNITGAISIAGWVYAVSTSIQQVFGGYASVPPYHGYGFGISVSIPNKWVWFSGLPWTASTSDVALNTWTHIAFTLNSTGTLNIYLNGALDRTTTAPVLSSYNGQRALGARADGIDQVFSGTLIDEFGIWNRVLTASEMLILYNSGAGITFPF
jgi:hypothetical protein